MSGRSFTVFQDAPSSEPVLSKATRKSALRPLPATSTASNPSNSVSTLAAIDKENVNPLTGERAGCTSNINAKKRKTHVLAVKSCRPSDSKDHAYQKPEKKKRKPQGSSTSKEKSTKKAPRAGSGRKGTRRSPRLASPLPMLMEDAEAEREKEHITQVNIDSKCYELTVQPLADVSRAYDELHVGELCGSSRNMKVSVVKESSAEPELRDYFSPASIVPSVPPDVKFARASTPVMDAPDTKTFSTPERKRIYSAFTFSTPSPSSERYRKITRSTSVPLFSLNDKDAPSNPASSP